MSKRTEMREVTITVCDYCGKDITDYSHTGTEDTKTGKKRDFHSMYTGRKTCLEKVKEEERKAYLKENNLRKAKP